MKRNVWHVVLVTTVSLVCVSLLIQCGEDEGSGSSDPFQRAYANYLSNCAQCHSPETSTYQDVDLDLSSVTAARASLTSTADIPGKPDCSAQRYVVANQVDGSMLMAVLDDAVRPTYEAATNCIPTDLTTMSMDPPAASVLADIQAWIEAGAN